MSAAEQNHLKALEIWQQLIGNDILGEMPRTVQEFINVRCRNCKSTYNIKLVNLLRKRDSEWFVWCRECVCIAKAAVAPKRIGVKMRPQALEHKRKTSEAMKRKWEDPEYRKLKEQHILEQWSDEEFKRRHYAASMAVQEQRNVSMKQHHSTIEFREKQAGDSVERWKDHEYRDKVTSGYTSGRRATISSVNRARQSRPEVKEMQREATRKLWEDPEYQKKQAAVDRRSPTGRRYHSTSPHSSVLEDLVYQDLHHIPEQVLRNHALGGWSFDFVLPESRILIEVQGPHHRNQHGLSYLNEEAVDKQKITDANKKGWSQENGWRLVYIEESDFLTANLIWKKLGSRVIAEVETKDVVIRLIDAPTSHSFLHLHHYLHGGRVSAFRYGAYYRERLIGVAEFATKEEDVSELARFCLHPGYTINNGASFLISRTTHLYRFLKPNVKKIVTYADPDQGHTGTIYKASNYEFVTLSEPQLYYKKGEEFIHERTMYRSLRKLGLMTNLPDLVSKYQRVGELAAQGGYERCYGSRKKKFEYVYQESISQDLRYYNKLVRRAQQMTFEDFFNSVLDEIPHNSQFLSASLSPYLLRKEDIPNFSERSLSGDLIPASMLQYVGGLSYAKCIEMTKYNLKNLFHLVAKGCKT